MRKRLVYAFRGPEGWYCGRLQDDPIGPYKSPEAAFGAYCIGKFMSRYKLVIEGEPYGSEAEDVLPGTTDAGTS